MINESNFNSNIDLTPYKAPICASWDSMALQQSQANCNGTDVPSYVRQVFEIGKNLENSYQSINARAFSDHSGSYPELAKKLAHSVGVKSSMISAMAS